MGRPCQFSQDERASFELADSYAFFGYKTRIYYEGPHLLVEVHGPLEVILGHVAPPHQAPFMEA